MASKTSSFSGFAFFLSFNLLFSMLFTTTCAGSNPQPILPPPTPTSSSPAADGKCGKDGIKIGICAKLLNNDLLKVIDGQPPVTPCCSLIEGLADLEAAACLCTAIKASVLGIDLVTIPISLTLLLNNCGGKPAQGFQCS